MEASLDIIHLLEIQSRIREKMTPIDKIMWLAATGRKRKGKKLYKQEASILSFEIQEMLAELSQNEIPIDTASERRSLADEALELYLRSLLIKWTSLLIGMSLRHDYCISEISNQIGTLPSIIERDALVPFSDFDWSRRHSGYMAQCQLVLACNANYKYAGVMTQYRLILEWPCGISRDTSPTVSIINQKHTLTQFARVGLSHCYTYMTPHHTLAHPNELEVWTQPITMNSSISFLV